MRNKKYRLSEEEDCALYPGLHRIIALVDIPKARVRAGDVGGLVSGYRNLDTDVKTSSWIYSKAVVSGSARVLDDAIVKGSARVSGRARVFDEAIVGGFARVSGRASISGRSVVVGRSVVRDDAVIRGNARVSGNAQVIESAEVYDNARVEGSASVCMRAYVRGGALVCGDAIVSGESNARGSAVVRGSACLIGRADISGDALIERKSDYMVFKNTWSSGRYFTCFRTVSGGIMWKVGCFCGTGEELVKRAFADSELCGRCYARAVRMAEEMFADIQDTEKQ